MSQSGPKAAGIAPAAQVHGPERSSAEAAFELLGFELAVDEERYPPLVRETSFKPFVPANVGPHLSRFQELAERIGGLKGNEARQQVEGEIGWAEKVEAGFHSSLRPRSLKKYRAALSVLVDLLSQGWVHRFRDHVLELAPPDFTEAPASPEDIARQKRAIRNSMRSERIAQLQPDSVRRFLADMETRKARGGRPECSILDLVADGQELAQAFRGVMHDITEDAAADVLGQVIQPYLQLVADDGRCIETGMRLSDIWRYFRYYWSLPYFSTPGRNLFYLVRDRRRRFHPVIGIAALGNSIVRLADRERWIGWDLAAIEERIAAKATPAERDDYLAREFEHLVDAVERQIGELDPTGVVTKRELVAPNLGLVQRLYATARESAFRRKDLLKRHELQARASGMSTGVRPRDPSQIKLAAPASRTLADRSVEELFKQKRAAQFAELLRAKLEFMSARTGRTAAQAMQVLLSTDEGRRSTNSAIRIIKQDHIGSSMMDIIICGSIPPYSHLLGGKLVCMLLCSPQVQQDYRERYVDSPSEIASRMRGQDHSRKAELVFLGTTSLYHVGSSQYNRVKLPAAQLTGGQGEIRYHRLGETRGYGSVHFNERTRSLLEDVLRDEQGAIFITRTFGEGVNPKLRLVREGLGVVGLDQDHFLQHQCRRIIYGVPLAHNTEAYLRNEQREPDYVLKARTRDDAIACTDAISAHWMKRWLAPRVRREDVLQSVASSTKQEVLISAVAAQGTGSAPEPTEQGEANKGGGGRTPPPSAGEIGVRFIQQLYNNRSCYADRLTAAQLEAIHVTTPLEDFIIRKVKAGKDVILTGNPGDGKTHLLMRLGPRLAELGVEVHLDATAEETYEALRDLWASARRRKKSFCLAINEWPLMEFVETCGQEFKPLQDVEPQIEGGIIYGQERGTDPSVVVIDLNNRNLISKDVFKQLATTLTSERFYPECAQCPAQQTCDVPRGRRALQQTRVQEQLFTLLELVTKRGYHVTMRDLQGFLSYLLTGGRSCEELVNPDNEGNSRPYYDLAFEGDSDLFDSIRDVFDPAAITHPVYDDDLWANGAPGPGWIPALGWPNPPPSKTPDPDKVMDAMRSAKRRFFFEHEDGAKLLQLLPMDERKFYEALSDAPGSHDQVIRSLVKLLNKFFDPRDTDDSAIRLWTRHRYDARWSPTYVSIRSVPNEHFKLEVPRLASVTSAAFMYSPDHVHLAAYKGTQRVARLVVDLSLYRTLYDAQRGLPMALRSAEVLKRIDVFFNELARAFHEPRRIEDVHIKNFQTGEDLRFKVDRQYKRYSI